MVTLTPLFLCTHENVGLAIVFRCYGNRSKVFQVYPSLYEAKLRSIPGLTVCCSEDCCQRENTYSTNNTYRIENHSSGSNIHGAFYRSVWGSSEFYSSPHFWTAVVVLLLVCFMILQNIYSYKRASRVLPLLERETSGPYSSTREGTGGIILPKLVYTEKKKEKEKISDPPKQKRVITEILNAADLMALEIELDQDKSEDKILSDEQTQRVYISEKTNTRTRKRLKIELFDQNFNDSSSMQDASSNLQDNRTEPIPDQLIQERQNLSLQGESESEPPSNHFAEQYIFSNNDPPFLPNQVQDMGSENSCEPPDSGVTGLSLASNINETVTTENLMGGNSTQVTVQIENGIHRNTVQSTTEAYGGNLLVNQNLAAPGFPDRTRRRYSIEYSEPKSESLNEISTDATESVQNLPELRREDSMSVPIPDPLLPAYHPHRRVSGVWRDENSIERLYRYTHMDRLVYPPGYIT